MAANGGPARTETRETMQCVKEEDVFTLCMRAEKQSKVSNHCDVARITMKETTLNHHHQSNTSRDVHYKTGALLVSSNPAIQ